MESKKTTQIFEVHISKKHTNYYAESPNGVKALGGVAPLALPGKSPYCLAIYFSFKIIINGMGWRAVNNASIT